MVKLTISDVEHVAKLSKLKLTSPEKKRFQKQLKKVLEYMNELDEVDVSKVEPTSQTTGLENNERTDKRNPQRDLSKDAALSGAAKNHKDYFLVPMVLKNKH